MKIHRLVQMLGLINESGRLASDMYDLNNKEYYSKSENKYIPISHMDFQHMVRAFVKQNDCDTMDKVDAQEKIIAGLRSQVETLQDMYRNMASEVHRTNGCAYVFCEVPQDEKGREFIKNCREYLNTKSYTIRVRGQHLKKDLYGQGRASWGANMEDSSHMRVYIDKKKGDK